MVYAKSLRWHYPDQVMRVERLRSSQPLSHHKADAYKAPRSNV